MKKKADSCLLVLVLTIYFCATVFAATMAESGDFAIEVEQVAENSGEIFLSGDSNVQTETVKLGAKAFIESIVNGQFFKKVLVVNEERIIEEMKQEQGENIIIEVPNVSGEELIDVSDVITEEVTISVEIEPEVVYDPQSILIDGVQTHYDRYMDVTATAYCLCQKCCGKSPSSPGYGRTASGLVITPGKNMKVVAVDPKMIKLGTNVYVEGLNGAPTYGKAIAADTGGAIKGNRIDLYFDTHQQALKWGRRSVRVYVLPSE